MEEAIYNPPVEENHDETNEMYNVAADEAASNEMSEFLETLEKDKVGDVLKITLQKKLEFATSKLSELFKKQQELAVEEEMDIIELQKEVTIATVNAQNEEKTNKKQDNMKQLMLQKKVTALNNQVELSEQKARSVTIQWAMDKEKFKGEIVKKQREIHELTTRLSVMERKARHGDQLARDSNMVDDGPVDLVEMERLREDLNEAHVDIANKQKRLLEISKDLNETKTELRASETKVELLTNRVEELVKSTDAMHDVQETRDKEDANMAKQHKTAMAEMAELVKELRREQATVQQLESDLAAQKTDYEAQIAEMNVADLLKRIKGLEDEIHAQKDQAAVRERELKREADHSRIEKEQLARENKHLAVAINKVASMSKTITADIDAHKDAMDGRLDSELKKSQHMYAEIKALSKSIDSIAGDAGRRANELQVKMDQLKHASDAAEVEFEAERERLEMRVLDMQKEMHAKDKTIKTKIAAATQAEIAAKEAALKEVGTANMVIDRLNEKITGLQRRLASTGTTADAEKYLTDLEAEKEQFAAKMDAKDAALLQIKKELADAAAAKEALAEEVEAERERYEELRTDLKHLQEELEIREQQVSTSSTTAKSISLPQSSEGAAQRELSKMREELLATKKDLAAKQKEIKTLQKVVEKAEKSEKMEKKPVAKKEKDKDDVRPLVSSKGRRTKAKIAITSDSDSDEDRRAAKSALERTASAEADARAQETGVDTDAGPDSYQAYVDQQQRDMARSTSAILTSAKADTATVSSQTDATISIAKIDKKRVEAILREAILTDNYYFSKQTSSFTNVYPVEEHLMEDLVDSFHSLSQDMLATLRGVTGHGMSLRESSKQDEITAKQVVENLEAMILKAGKDLVINLEKSKERNFKKLVAEQRGKLESMAGAADVDIADAREEVMQEMTAAFQKQLRELQDDKAAVEARLEETEDLLAVERAKVIEATMGGFPAASEKRSVRSRKAGAGAASGGSDVEDDVEVEEEEPEILNAEREVTNAEARLLEIATTASAEDEVAVTDGKSLPVSKAGVTSQFQAVAVAKQRLMQLRKERNERKAQQAAEMEQNPHSAPASPDSAGPSRADSPGSLGTLGTSGGNSKSVRRKVQQSAKFDELDTGADVLRRLTAQQTDDLKSLVLIELNEEVKQKLLDQEKALKEKAAKEDHHHVTRDIEALKEDLRQGKLQNIGEVRVSDFDRLRNKLFGTDDLISLTIVEHHIRFGGASDMYEDGDQDGKPVMNKEEAKKHALKRRQYRMLIRSMVLQRELLLKTVTANVPLLELMRYKHSTEVALAQLSVLSAWRALNYYRGGGVFRDVLEVHLEVIDKCIVAAGGWQAALAQIENAPEAPLEVDTAQWPEFFRVRVLELLRTRYSEELDRTRVKLSTASMLFTQLRPAEFIQNSEVLPFDQILETEANRSRLESMRAEASSKAESFAAPDQFKKLNSSVKKLSAVAALSFQRYSSTRGGFGNEDEEWTDTTPSGGTPTQVRAHVIHAGGFDSSGFGTPSDPASSEQGFSAKSTNSYGFESSAAEGASMTSISENDNGDVSGGKGGPVFAAAGGEAVAEIGKMASASVGIAHGLSGALAASPQKVANVANSAQATSKSTPAKGKSDAFVSGALPKGVADPDASWLQDEDDERSISESVGSGKVDPPAPSHKNSPQANTSKSSNGKGPVSKSTGKGKTSASTSQNCVHFGAGTKDGGMPSSELFTQLGGAFDARDNRGASPSGNDSVVSNLSSSTAGAPTTASAPKVPTQTKAAAVRQKAQNLLKFSKHDAVKLEEKKRKAAKAAEQAAANQKAAGENTAKLASAIGDMFASSEDEGGNITKSDTTGSRSASPVQQDSSHPHHARTTAAAAAHITACKPGSPTSRGLHLVIPEDLVWMHTAADKIVMAALYGDDRASQLIHCILDGIHHWEEGQAGTAAVVLKAAGHMHMVPELVTELAQRAAKRSPIVPPIVLELRDKFANIMAFITKLAHVHEQHEQYLNDHVLGSQIASAHLHPSAHAPYLPVHNAYPTGGPSYVLDTSTDSSAVGTTLTAASGGAASQMRGSVVHPHHAHQAHPHHPTPHVPSELHVVALNVDPNNPNPSQHHEPGHHAHHPSHSQAGDAPQHHSRQHKHPDHHHATNAHHQQHHPAATDQRLAHGAPGSAHSVAYGVEFLPYNPVLQGPVFTSAHPVNVFHAPGPHPQSHANGHAHGRHTPMEYSPDPHAPPSSSTAPAGQQHSHTHAPSRHGHEMHGQGHGHGTHGSHGSTLGHHPHAAHVVRAGHIGQAHPHHVQEHRGSSSSPSHPHPGHVHFAAAASGPTALNVDDGLSTDTHEQMRGPMTPTTALFAAARADRDGEFRAVETPPDMQTLHRSNSIGAIKYKAPAADVHPGMHRFMNMVGPPPQFSAGKQGASKRKVAVFDNSTQTAHGSIQVHDLSGAGDEGDNVISSLVKTLLLDGWDRKVKKMVTRKKNLEPHTIITSATAVPAIFPTAPPDPFASASTTTVFKGFEHAYFDEAEFEVVPGVRLASAHRIAGALRAYAKEEREKLAKLSSSKTSPAKHGSSKASKASSPLRKAESSADLSHEDDIHIGSWIVSTNVRYCIRSDGADYGKRLKKAPFYLKAPVIPGCEAVVFPNVFPVKQGVNLITGEQCALGGNLALPEDVLMLQVAEDTAFPHGLTKVELSPVVKLSSSLEHYMQRAHPLPVGHHLVQITKPSSVALPEGVEVSSGVTIAATPPELDLPSNIILVRNPLNDDLPEYMHKLQAVTTEEDDLIAEMKLNEFCCIVKRPIGIDFGLGVEILQRPPGHPLPPGMTLLPKDSYPDGLILPEELELVQLTPRFDFPHGCRINADWKVWPRPDGMRLPPGVQIVFPDSTSAVPTLPPGVCPTYMPDIPYGVLLPPNSQAVEIFGSAAGKSALPEGAILTPGITVLNSDELIPSPGSKNYVMGSHARALNVLLVHRMPGTSLPPLVERGSKSDLPFGTLLAENMDIVRVAVRFELPPGVRIQAGAKLGPFTQIAPGTDLVTLSGGKPDEDYSCTIRVLEWPHGVSLTPGTEFVRRPPAGYYLPVGYKEVVPPKVDVMHASSQGSWMFPQIPEYGMLVELPRAVHYATAQNLAEQITAGLESTLEDKIVTIPLGMVLAARKSKQCQWPAEMTLAPKSSLGANLVRVINKINSDNNLVMPAEAVGPTHTPSGPGDVKKDVAPSAMHLEVVKLKPHYALPPGCELLPGVVVQRKPFWLHVPSGVELISRHVDSTGRQLPFTCKGVTRVQLRPDFILTGSELDSISDPSTGLLSPSTTTPSSLSRTQSMTTLPNAPTRVAKDWELVDLEHTIKLSPMSLPAQYELVHVSELLDSVHSWGPYLKGVEVVSRNTCEEGKPLLLPPLHFLIQRPRTLTVEPLPEGFQLGIARDYAAWHAPSLPPNVEIMHLVPSYHLPMGINILNTSVLSKTEFNTLQNKAAQECNIPQLQAGERISAGFSVIAKPFGSIALQKILTFDSYYLDEAHAFVRVHDPRHFQLPKMMTLDKHSDKVVESVFGAELPPQWRKGYRSKHDDLGESSSEGSHQQQNKTGAGTGDLYITDIIKFVRLPHGFPPPRERQKRAQTRFALLKPAIQKVANATKIVAFKKSVTTDEVKDANKLETPLTHTHTHHQKNENTGELTVYPRLLCIHKRDAPQGEEARQKFLTNVLLHRLMKPELKTQVVKPESVKIPAGLQVESSKSSPEKGPLAKVPPALIAPTDTVLFDESLHLLQDLLEATYTENVANKEVIVKQAADTEAAQAALKEATDKNTTYEKQLSYDEDLKVLIHRLNLKLKCRTVEIDEINNKNTEVNDRLLVQLELLNSQVAYYQDLTESMGGNKSFSDPPISPHHGSPGSNITAAAPNHNATNNDAPSNNALSLEQLEKFSSNLHQKYRDQVLAGLEKLSEMYAGSIRKILEDFEAVLINWPNWSPKEAMLAAVAWSKNQPYGATGGPQFFSAAGTAATSSATSSVAATSVTKPAASLAISTGADDAASVLSYGLTPPKVTSSTGIKVRAPAGIQGTGLPNIAFEDEDISVLSDGESSVLVGGNIAGNPYSNASLAGSLASSQTSNADLSLSGYQPRDLTKDEFGRPIPLTPGFPLNVKGLYAPLSQDPNIDIVPLSTSVSVSVSVSASAGGSSSGGSVSTLRSKAPSKVQSGHDLKLLQKSLQLPAPTATAHDSLIERLELSHSLNDLFAKQRRAMTPAKEKEKMIGKLPKLIHTTTAIPSAPVEETEAMALNIQFLDPAVLGAGAISAVAPQAHPHSHHGTIPGGSVTGAPGTVISNEENMTVSADITALQVADFLKSDSHRAEMKQKLTQSTAAVVESVRKDFSTLLSSVHSAVINSIPKVIEQYKKEMSNDSKRCISLIADDYGNVSNTALTSLQSSLGTVARNSGHYMKYALGTLLLHADVSLQQADVEGDILRHRLFLLNKRAEMLEYLLQEARRKGTEDNQHAVADALKEKVLSLESSNERLLGLHVDPAVSVLATLVKRLQDLSDYEKQLKFSAILFKQKSAQVEARLQANRDFEFNHSHKAVGYHHLSSDSEGEDEGNNEIGFSTKGLTVDSRGVSPPPRATRKRIPAFHLLDRKEIKAMKHYAHSVRMKARHCHARAHVLRKDCDELMVCIMEHMEAYQRAAQQLLPAHLLEQVLRASTRKYQDVSAGMKLSRVRAAHANHHLDPAHHDTDGKDALKKQKTGVERTDKRSVMAAEEEDAISRQDRRDSDVISLAGSEASSVMSANQQSVASGKYSINSSGLKVLKPVRVPAAAESSVMAQRILVDASRTLTQPKVKFGAAGSMPVAPAQSHLLLRGTVKRVTPNFNK